MKLPVINPILRLIGKLLSVAVFFLTILAAYCGRINPDYFAFPSIIVLLLPYLGVATALITIAWFIGGRWIFGALGVATLAFCWTPLSNVAPLKFSQSPEPGATTFKLLTYNILHGEDMRHPEESGKRSIRFLTESGADIICLQELFTFEEPEVKGITKELRDSLFAVYPYRAGGHSVDLTVLSKYPVRLTDMGNDSNFPRVRYFSLDIKGKRLIIGNMHLISYDLSEDEREVVTDIKSVSSAKKSISEFKGTIKPKLTTSFKERAGNVRKMLSTLESVSGPLIVCGDFNDVPESYAYRLMRAEGFRDAYADTGFGPIYTYNAHLFLFHLDQVFYRGPLKALSVKKERINSSDHYPLMVEFEFTDSFK